MGTIGFSKVSKSTYDPPAPVTVTVRHEHVTVPPPPNPNPYRFKVLEWEHIGLHLVIKVRYLDCTTYEGVKILVYRRMVYGFLMLKARAQGLDPHFSKSRKMASPFARFEPTTRGWRAAINLAKSLS